MIPDDRTTTDAERAASLIARLRTLHRHGGAGRARQLLLGTDAAVLELVIGSLRDQARTVLAPATGVRGQLGDRAVALVAGTALGRSHRAQLLADAVEQATRDDAPAPHGPVGYARLAAGLLELDHVLAVLDAADRSTPAPSAA